jgi:serine/threonine-protein kinase
MSGSEPAPAPLGADRAVPSAGDRLGDFQVLFELAKGGMATVHLARQSGDAGFERLVAIKRVHPHLVSDPEVFAMASDEARIAALVRHSNVVAVTGVFDARGELVLVQEYVEGFSLARVLRALGKLGQSLPRAVAARIALDLTRGLAATHGARDLRGEALGIVHRDVSPENVLVGTDGTARLIDFGIARSERRMTETRTGVLKGKLSYMAPEQIAEETVDQRADLYAAGLVLYEMLAGTRAFESPDDASLMAKILSGAVDVERVPEEWRAVVERALARDPADRFADATELARAIREVGPLAGEEDVSALLAELFRTELEVLRERIASSIARVELEAAPEEAAGDESSSERAAVAEAERADPSPQRAASPQVALRGGAGVRPATVALGALVGAGLFGAGWYLARQPDVEPVASSRPGSLVEASPRTPGSDPVPAPTASAGLTTVHDPSAASASAAPAPSPSAPSTRSDRSASAPRSPTLPVPSSPSGVVSASARPDLQPSPYGPK